VRAGDIVVIPCQPTLLDVDRVGDTLELALSNGRPAAVLLTRTRPHTRALAAALEALNNADVPVLEGTIPQREAIAAAFGSRPEAHADLFGAVLDQIEEALR
jgi:chromosome partitioning protein